jgi:lysophospholipase L1-like esterase
MAANPLIANYYGTDSTMSTINYDNADCGYGIGQLTDFMTLASTAQPQSVKEKVAVDYAENIAAALQVLAGKWNALASNGITVNNSDPAYVENWYFAAWAYNSGIHTDDGSGHSGLGWANNPANPIYPPNRLQFLSQGYGDATHPQDWPYQELVMGWVQFPLIGPNGFQNYQRLLGLNLPTNYKMFCTAANNCDPSNASQPCLLSDLHCWWHWSAQFTTCPSQCNTGFYTVASSASEPNANLATARCQLEGREFNAGATIVFNEPTDLNLLGCPTAPVTWTATGSYSVAYGTNAAGAPTGVIDYHQIGEGFGGHFFFTHTEPSTDTAHSVVVTWTPPSSALDGLQTEVLVYVPGTGGTTRNAMYVIYPGGGQPAISRSLDQNAISDAWATLGYYSLSSGATVTLSNLVGGAGGDDIAYTALAFVHVNTYAALGDSYAAGEGAPPFFAATDTSTDTCHRTFNSYPEQYSQLTNLYGSRPIIDVTCSGAVTSNIDTTAENVEGIQINEIPVGPSLITISIGGNDLNFDQIARDCVNAYVIGGQTCQQRYTDSNGQDIVSQRIQSLRANLRRVYTALRNKVAPGGTVAVLTYPQVLDSSTSNGCINEPIIASDRDWLRAKTHEFDQAIISEAQSVGVSYLDEENAFAGHEICKADPYANGVYNPPYVEYSLHPNASGHAKEAADLQAWHPA